VAPGTAAVELSAIPVAAVLAMFFMLCRNIARDRSFCPHNARLLRDIGICALADTVYCAAGMVVFWFLHARQPGIYMFGVMAMVFGTLVAAAGFLLSHLVRKAGEDEETVKYTI
jgi:hypothetical protein